MSDDTEKVRPGEARRRRPVRGRRRIPAWVVVPLAAAAGFVAASWMGMAFGLVAGILLWLSRR